MTASGSSCSELYEFLDGYFFNLRKCLLRIFPYCHFWNHTYENSNRPVFVNMNLVILLAICAHILVDSLPFKSCQIQICHVHDHQFDRTTYGKADWKKLSRALHWVPGHFFIQTFGSDCLELCFKRVASKTFPGSVILQKYHSLWNHSFKHTSAHIPSLN